MQRNPDEIVSGCNVEFRKADYLENLLGRPYCEGRSRSDLTRLHLQQFQFVVGVIVAHFALRPRRLLVGGEQ